MSRIAMIVAAVFLASPFVEAGEEQIRLVEGPGRDLTATHCVTCHSLDYIPMNAPLMNRASWQKSVRKMIDKFGAPIDEADATQILDYLTEHYAAPASPMRVR